MSDPVTEHYKEFSDHILELVKANSKDQATELLNKLASEAVTEADAQAAAMARFIKAMNKIKIQFGILGAASGAAAGGMIAFAIAYRKAETKYSKLADTEIEEMREHYQARRQALEAEASKGDLKEIVRERGYVSGEDEDESDVKPPMAVQPPTSRLFTAGEEQPDDAGDIKSRNVFQEAEVTHKWNWHEERSRRSPIAPYVVHQDEIHEFEGYQDVTLTYYEEDDVLCSDRDEIVDAEDRDRLIGEKNLERFGHGSNDASIVYIRNDKLEIMYEVVKSPNSYAEEVHGIKHDGYDRGNIRRMRARERDEE